MQIKTKEKIIAIQNMINNGIDEKEIIKLKFKSSPKAYKEWFSKFGSYLTFEEKKEILPTDNVSNLFIPNNQDLIKLKQLLDNTDSILKLIETNYCNNDVKEINMLEVPDELLKLYDIKISSLRLSKAIEIRFNNFVDKNKKYSKTSLINMALVEFLDKYE